MIRKRPATASPGLESSDEIFQQLASQENTSIAYEKGITGKRTTSSPSLPGLSSAPFSGKLWALVPYCITAPLGKTHRVLPAYTSTSYLDGLRGLACIIVFNQHVLHLFCHWSLRAYGTPGIAKNALQLPVIRVIYAGDGMVSLFFVLSGYVLGYSPLRMIHSKAPSDEFLTSLSSSVLRRGVRLFVPMLAFGLVTAVLTWFLPWYEAPQPMNTWRQDDDNSLSAFIAHLGRFAVDALSGIDPSDFSWEKGKPAGWIHCWTIPHEYRGSLAVYLACLATCKLTSATRRMVFVGLALWFMCSPRHYWLLSCFFGGLFLAEIRISPISTTHSLHPWQSWGRLFSVTIRTSALLFSTILLGWPIWGSTTQQPYGLLRQTIIPKTWATDGYPEGDQTRSYLYSIGAFMLLWAIEGLPWAQRLLSRPLLVYLGEICYSFFLLHWMVLYSFGRYLYSYLHYIGIYSWNGSLVVYLSTLAITIIAADLFWRAIDENSIKFAKWLVRDWLKAGQEAHSKGSRHKSLDDVEAIGYNQHQGSILPL